MRRGVAAACAAALLSAVAVPQAVAVADAEPPPGFSPPAAARSTVMRFAVPEGGPLAFRGAIAVQAPFDEFGGLSGAVMEGPRDLLAISDRGVWVRMKLAIEGGRLTGVSDVRRAPMLHYAGADLMPGARDAEGLARDPATGRLWVSFEGYHRIYVYREPGGSLERSIARREWETFSEGRGLEGLARAPDGRLWAFREGRAEDGTTSPVYVGRAEDPVWEEKRLPLIGPFSATGADFGPDGWLYVTERAFSFIGGFRFRLRRLKWGEGPDPIAEETLLSLGAETYIDNIEAVTLWREAGRTYLLILSDDNFLAVERNVVALFEVTG